MSTQGAYTAERASALSGVPKSTIHWWARNDVLVPSVSPETRKLWSYEDLIALRLIYWLRQKKTSQLGHELSSTSLSVTRLAVKGFRALDLPLQTGHPWSLFVTALTAPFTTAEGHRGPDLVRPRPQLLIVPGRLSGSPHIEATRVETKTVAALKRDGASLGRILTLYPFLTAETVEQAIGLEEQLAGNLNRQAA